MSEIGAYDAKTHLPRLLDQVEQGERFIITRHGRPVAELAPVAQRDEEQIRRALQRILEHRAELAKQGVRLKDILEPGETLRDLTHRGHRYY